MILNRKKCKELIICFLKRTVKLQPFVIAKCELKTVQSYKALGLTIQSSLKWNEHTQSIIVKASKRFHILRILRRCVISPADLIKVYIALIRSILEYSCEVWGNSITQYQSIDLEIVQKRVMHIIFLTCSYDKALEIVGCERLDSRHAKICISTLCRIIKQGSLEQHVLQTSSPPQHPKFTRSITI